MSKSATEKTEVRRRGRGAQTVYESLRSEILRLELRPGELLDESSLSQRFGMSRSPVREALIRLSMEGLVATLPNKNTLVAPLNIEEYPAYLDALDLIQRVTTRLAARLRTEADLKHIEDCQQEFLKSLDTNDIPGMIETNRDFHMAIGDAAKNRYFDFLHSRLMDDGRRMLHLYFCSFEGLVPNSIRRDHDLIIEAIKARDEDLAEKCAHDHVIDVGKRFLGYLNRRHILEFNLDPPD
ncbi:MAG: GntR family transcriptional regulator [Hyphomicrobiales bacterium]|nr:GntR family transcriptional regulator [Hyphomicrobiales bacterium]